METPVIHALPPTDPDGPRGITHYGGQSEPAPTLCTNVDGWCTDGCTFFVPPCPWPNQGGEFELTFFFLSSAQVGSFFLQTFFFLTPPPPNPPRSDLPTFRLLAYAPWPPPSPTYLPTHLFTYSPICLPSHQPAYLCTYARNLHQSNDDAGR